MCVWNGEEGTTACWLRKGGIAGPCAGIRSVGTGGTVGLGGCQAWGWDWEGGLSALVVAGGGTTKCEIEVLLELNACE